MVSKKFITQVETTTPEELTNNILKGMRTQLNEFKKEFAPTTPEKYLTRVQTAKMLSISLSCLHDWTNKQILKPMKLGNRTYFKLSEIENTLTSSNTL